MDFKKTNIYLTISLCLLFATFLSYAGNQENILSNAIQLFNEGKFTDSEQILKNLLDEKPDHLLINYYYGACRTENGHYGTKEVIHLLNGSIGEAPIKSDYYIAVQYHAKNRWDEALKHYTRFKGKATNEQQKEVQLSEKIQQCYSNENPFAKEDSNSIDVLPTPVSREKEIEEYTPIQSSDSISDVIEIDIKESATLTTGALTYNDETPTTEVTPQKSEPINFSINGEITYLDSTHFRTKEGLDYYSNGSEKEKELEARITEVDALRKKYGYADSYSKKQTLGEQILTGENDIYTLQNETNQLLLKAKQEEINYWESASTTEKETFTKDLDEYLKASQEIAIPEIEFDTTSYIDPNILLIGTDNISKKEEKTSDELNYKIQLGAYSRGLPSYVKNLFKKLSYLRKIENYTDEKGIVVYTTGNLTNYEDALKMQNQVRQEGVEDAFVVPYFNGKRITLKEAKEIEAVK